MTGSHTITQNTVTIAGQRFVLAQGHSLDQVKEHALQAVRDHGALLDLIVYGNTEVSVLVSPGVPVVFTSETINVSDQDDRDTKVLAAPFEPFEPFEDFTFPL